MPMRRGVCVHDISWSSSELELAGVLMPTIRFAYGTPMRPPGSCRSVCPQLLFDRISYATNSRSQPPDVSGVQYPDILHQRKALHRDRFDVFAQDGGMKYLRHHEPQS